jgi:hypothetical protein
VRRLGLERCEDERIEMAFEELRLHLGSLYIVTRGIVKAGVT